MLVVIATLGVCSALYAGKDWPGWRGPTGMGVSDERDLPVAWGGSDDKNVLWKAPLFEHFDKIKLDQNQSSPIVRGDRVLVTTSYWPVGVETSQFPEHHVTCFHAATGQRLWDKTVAPGPWLLKDLRGGYTAPTPAADDSRVFVLFGSSVLAALDLTDGSLLWRKEITPHHFDVAIGNSPVIHKGTVLLVCDQLRGKKSSTLLAFDAKSGELRWEKKRDHADWTHSTPALAEIEGKTQLLVAGDKALEGLDPVSGDILWRFTTSDRIGDTVTPLYANGLVYIDSGRGGPAVAVDPTGRGDVTKTHLKWNLVRIPDGFSSPVSSGPFLLRLHSPETIKCIEWKSGRIVWSERLQGMSTAASPFVTPEGRVYCASAGVSYVIQPGEKCAVLAVNDLKDGSQASPAVADGRIFLKGRRYLHCVGKRP
jgi:outer membrane protein assembly factor BamB